MTNRIIKVRGQTHSLSPADGPAIARRAFAGGALALAVAPFGALAQQQRSAPLRLALVSAAYGVDELTEAGPPSFGLVLSELRRLGLVEGQNLIVERWSNAGRPESEVPDLAKRVAASRPDIIYVTAASATAAVKAATTTIPVVFTAADPIGWGIVERLNRPGGNITGFASDAGPEIYQKQLQMLAEAANTKRIVYLFTEGTSDTPINRAVREAARLLGVELGSAMAEGPINEVSISRALTVASPQPGMALYVHPAGTLNPFGKFIAAEALRLHLPAISNEQRMARDGLLMSYSRQVDEIYRGAAGYIVRIARGDKPGELPVQQSMRFDMVLNLKTAKALGLDLPIATLLQATEVIE